MMQHDYPAYSPRVDHTDYLTTSHVSPSTQPQIAAPPPRTPRRQIQINSTIDADIGTSISMC